MSARRLYIEVILGVKNAVKNISMLRRGLNLLSSTLRAVFRTAVIAAFFMALRSVYNTINSITNSVKTLTSSMAKLNLASTLTAAVLSKGTSQFKSAFDGSADASRALSNEVQYTAEQIQGGLYTAAIAGYNLSESFNLAKASMEMATIAGMDFKEVINGSIGIIKAFGFTMAQIPQIAANITSAFTHSKMTLQDFFTSMRYVAPVAISAFGATHKTFIDITAALMTMQDAGLQSSKAGVYLRSTIQKLASATSKVNAVLAEYGKNIFETNGDNQEFFSTIVKSRSALTTLEKQMNGLKQTQLDLAISGADSSDAYKSITEKIAVLNARMQTLKSGMSSANQQFVLAGGKLKPLRDVLRDISSIPSEVVTRAFGVRSGTGAALLLNQMGNFEKALATQDKYNMLVKQGQSILTNMFKKVTENISIQFQRVKNIIFNTFSIVFDAIAPYISDVIQELNTGFKAAFETVKRNKGLFREIGRNLRDALIPIIVNFSSMLQKAAQTLYSITSSSQTANIPQFGINQKTGKLGVTETKGVKGGIGDKLGALASSMFNLLYLAFKQVIDKLAPAFAPIGIVLGEAVATVLKVKIKLFTSIGGWIAKGLWDGLKAKITGIGMQSLLNIAQPGRPGSMTSGTAIINALNPANDELKNNTKGIMAFFSRMVSELQKQNTAINNFAEQLWNSKTVQTTEQ